MCVLCIYSIYFFFFFQAEDGIRDGTVTGVQTCALPIYGGLLSSVPRSGHPRESQIGEEFMMPRPTQANETERLPKNFPALQERMDIVKRDRKSTRLNSSHSSISYAVFCLKKKKKIIRN